ncbi:response regulator transcription factor [Salininema proteolyticum]|uniref:Response regulator transcription factor n=1 Tax=Salininema proteolyticum TaxID=1607685 RepID=A0ABV8TXQ7_9ACTN
MPHVVVVEDDAEVRRALVKGLRRQGYSVTPRGEGLPGIAAVREEAPDLVVLDLGLPDSDGLEIVAMLRSVSDVPIVVVTARDGEASMVKALDRGADDYIVKPFGVAQLDARLRAILRRVAPDDEDRTVVVGGLSIDPDGSRAVLDGTELDLTAREFDLLLLLARNAGKVVAKHHILSEVWQYGAGGSEGTVDVHLSWLRRKLGESASSPRYLHTVRGKGIRLEAPGEGGGR